MDGQPRFGFRTPSRRLEFFSSTLADFGWPELAIPAYVKSHVHPEKVDRAAKRVRSALDVPAADAHPHAERQREVAARDLASRTRPGCTPSDAERLGVATGDLVRIETEIGHFVDRVWVTEGIRPGVVACSHHLGRWRLAEGEGRAASRPRPRGRERGARAVDADAVARDRAVRLRRSRHAADLVDGSGRASEPHFPVQPDPVSGCHCLAPEGPDRACPAGPDRYGDVSVDTNEVSRGLTGVGSRSARRACAGDRGAVPTGCCRPFRPDRNRLQLPASPRERMPGIAALQIKLHALSPPLRASGLSSRTQQPWPSAREAGLSCAADPAGARPRPGPTSSS